jgi:integrase
VASVNGMIRQDRRRERRASDGEKPDYYQVRWKVGGKFRKQNFDRKRDADNHAATVEHTKSTGGYIDRRDGATSIGSYAQAWASKQHWRPSTQQGIEGILANYVISDFGDRTLASLRTTEVETWVKELSEDLSPGTVQNIYRVLGAIYRAAVRDRMVASSPCVGIKLPRKDKTLIVPLTVEQVEAIADAIGEKYRVLVILGAGGGLRISEALGMPVSGIDFLHKELRVTQQVVRVKGVTSLGPVKTNASVRKVPLAAVALSELSGYLQTHPRRPDELLVTDAQGSPIAENSFGQTFSRAAVRAGLPKGTRFHDLRHTFASALIAQGCSVKAVQMALGHESAAVTLNTYAHLWPSDTDRVRAAVESFLRPEARGSGG